MRGKGGKGDLEMDGKGDVSSVDPPSLLLMASPSVTSASLMIDLKGDEKTPHLHLTPSSFLREGRAISISLTPFEMDRRRQEVRE